MNLAFLHLCDSLFPIGAFAHSDGLESAATAGRIASAADLGEWLAVCLDASIGGLEGPAVWQAWRAARDGDVRALAALDEELTALRPSSAARSSSRAMGHRLLTMWSALHPDAALGAMRGAHPLPIAFAAAAAGAGVERRATVEAFAYTRLAATEDEAVKAEYQANTDEAMAMGVFGAPTYVFDRELFWGQDRLQMLEWRLTQKLGPPTAAAPNG